MAESAAQESHGEGEKDLSVGPKVELFYISYRAAEDNIFNLVDSLYQLEHHDAQILLGETSEVISEIVSDCQKKSAQIIKAPYADNVRSMITAIRKKLVSKVSLDADSSAQHGQRHLNSVLELLGKWSNMVDEIRSLHWGISSTLFRLTISQLHDRVVEMALECFLKFREDKQLDTWHLRVSESASSGSSFSITALDFLLSQMSAMRDIIQQYYRFLHKSFLSMASESSDEIICERVVNEHVELMVSAQERNKWRELDAIYIALEFGYLTNSVREALSEPLLLEIEQDVFVPQAIEDVFFLLQRVVERALATGNEGSAFAVGNHIVELLDPCQESELFKLLSLRHTFRGCHASQRIRIVSNQTKHQNSSTVPFGRGTNCPGGGLNSSTSTNSLGIERDKDEGVKAEPLSVTDSMIQSSVGSSLLTGVAAASLSGMNNWLKLLAEPTVAPLSDPNTQNIQAVPPQYTDLNNGNKNDRAPLKITSPPLSGGEKGGNSNKLPAPSNSTLESILLSALDLDVSDTDERDGIAPESTPLSLTDVAVHLTTLALAPTVITTLVHLFYSQSAMITNSSSCSINGGVAGKRSLLLISEELIRCRSSYYKLLKTESNALAVGIFNKYMQPALLTTFSRPYNIAGEVMEKRGGECEILWVLGALIPCSSSSSLQPKEVVTKPTDRSFSYPSPPSSSTAHSERGSKGGIGTGTGTGTGTMMGRSEDCNKNNINGLDIFYESDTDINTKRLMSVRKLLDGRLSPSARTEVLLQLAYILNAYLLDISLTTIFSEWGALLFHQEVLSMIRILEEASENSAINVSFTAVNQSIGLNPPFVSIKDAFSPIMWALKVLTLDQPADIRKYVIPLGVIDSSSEGDTCSSGFLSETKIRNIMGRRVDFLKDAVLKVKITFK